MTSDKKFLVTNRSASRVFYAIPEIGVKSREFQPGETKTITFAELEGLNYLPGGPEIIRNYLVIQDPDARKEFVGQVEPEYNMTAEDVKQLILYGSLDEWLDCLDFAPDGVIDLIKTLSIELPLTDTRKMATFKEKKGTNLASAIEARQAEIAEEKMEAEKAAAAAQRRVQPVTEPAPAQPTRRTSGSKYNVTKRQGE